MTISLPCGRLLVGNRYYGGVKWKHDIEDRLRLIINETMELRRTWEQRRLEAGNQVKALDAKLAAYQTALKDYWEYIDAQDK
ncbi:hypothetical protein ACFLUS_04805 [Chloroflexota bacterium]